MSSKEKLYERPLRRPIDAAAREAIHLEYLKRRHQIPVPTELLWHNDRSAFTIYSSWLSFNVGYTPELMIVEAEFSFAARMFATKERRKQALSIIEEIADDLDL